MSKMEFVHIGFGSYVSVRAMAKMTSAKNQSLIKIEKKKKKKLFFIPLGSYFSEGTGYEHSVLSLCSL